MFRLHHILTPSNWPHRKSSQCLPCKHSLQEEACRAPALSWSPRAFLVITPSFPSSDLRTGRGSAKILQSCSPTGFLLSSCKVIPLAEPQEGPHPGKSRRGGLALCPLSLPIKREDTKSGTLKERKRGGTQRPKGQGSVHPLVSQLRQLLEVSPLLPHPHLPSAVIQFCGFLCH